ncbi:response regulator [Arcicella sp. DC2W]|uniref:Response regulator n=1 Tax=Arcicella gelida TaxID=2984195 RepID=A0ABU5S360_9BACT|nr:response regulator [Arcicella sp. DC2W]MEA5402934.1 response regulator [Arcicella sp. DC2W]
MSIVSILIVEDEAIVALELQESLEQEGFKVVAIADNGREALEILKGEEIDLILLDIHIKGDWDGIETAIHLNTYKKVPFIYVTAYADNSTFERAKATMPSAYLIKPFRINDLRKAIELAMYHFSQKQPPILDTHEKAVAKKEPIEQEGILHFNNAIFIKQNYKYTKVVFSDIQYLKADGNYTYIQTIDKKHVIKNSLQNVIDLFNTEKFIRVHRSYAINVNYLTAFNENMIQLGEEEIPLGRNYKDVFLQLFKLL